MKYLALGCSIFLFVSCASTGVVSLAENEFYIGKKDGSPGTGYSLENKVAVMKEAKQFCEKKGKELNVTKEVTKPSAPFVLGSTELYFTCR